MTMTKKIFTAALLLTAVSVHAQTDTLLGSSLDEVVVTANKFPQKQSTTGKVITVITKDQIEKSNSRTVPQLLNDVAGITINGALSNLGTNPTIYMRGAQAGRTLILVDGVPVSDPSFIQNDFDLNLLSLNNIERIEIARGAQSTLYGSDAVAGVINVITVKKDVSKLINVQALASGGNYGTYRGNVKLYGKAGKLTYQTGYAKLSSKGFSAAYDSSGKKNFDNDGYNGDVANAAVQYQFTSELSARAFGRYSKYKTDVDYGSFNDDKDFTNTNSVLMGGGSFHYERKGLSVTGLYQYTENKRGYLDDSTDVSPSAFSNFAKDDYFAKSQFAEIFTNIQLCKNVSLLNGADYRYSSMNNQYSSPGYSAVFLDTSVSQSSAYASLFIHDNSSKLNVELGGRLNVHSQYGSNRTFTFNPSYTINKNYRVFGSIATGFKAPTLYQLFGGFVGNKALKPETSKTYEFGFQQTHNMFSTRITYFQRKIENGIDFDNALTYQYFNFLEQSVNGIEIEERAGPIKNLVILANYTFLKPTEMTQSRLNTKDTTYSYLLRRPQHSINLTAGYTYKDLYVSVTGKYVGKRFDAVYGVEDVLLGSYFILGAYAEYKFKQHFKFFVNAENVTNNKFFEVRGFNAIPAMVNGGVVFNW